MTAVPSVGAVLERTVADLHTLAVGATDKQREHNAKPPREGGQGRYGETYWSGYLHGLCAAIAKITGQDELQVALEYEALGS